MNKSEILLSALSDKIFLKEMVIDELCYTPQDFSEVELADLIINLGDIIISIQLKERNPKDMSSSLSFEERWVQRVCKDAKKQNEQTISRIREGGLPKFKNKRSREIFLNPNAKIIPLVVFMNEKVTSYSRVLKARSSHGINMNCMSFEDYSRMCETLVNPIDIVYYLEKRIIFYSEDIHNNAGFLYYTDKEGDAFFANQTMSEAYLYEYYAKKYGIMTLKKNNEILKRNRDFLSSLEAHLIDDKFKEDLYGILLLFVHMDILDSVSFCNKYESFIYGAITGRNDIIDILNLKLCSIVFITNCGASYEEILQKNSDKLTHSQVLIVVYTKEDEENFRVDFRFKSIYR